MPSCQHPVCETVATTLAELLVDRWQPGREAVISRIELLHAIRINLDCRGYPSYARTMALTGFINDAIVDLERNGWNVREDTKPMRGFLGWIGFKVKCFVIGRKDEENAA